MEWKDHDISDEENSVTNESDYRSTYVTDTTNNGDITNNNISNVNATGLVSNIDENKELEQIQN